MELVPALTITVAFSVAVVESVRRVMKVYGSANMLKWLYAVENNGGDDEGWNECQRK
jgi:hypothetical protein